MQKSKKWNKPTAVYSRAYGFIFLQEYEVSTFNKTLSHIECRIMLPLENPHF